MQGLPGVASGMCAVCFNSALGADFAYGIGTFCKQDDICPEGFVLREIPAHLWAKFRAIGPLPGALQRLNRQIYTQWMPGNEQFVPAEGMNIEVYGVGDAGAAEYESCIWIPVRERKYGEPEDHCTVEK